MELKDTQEIDSKDKDVEMGFSYTVPFKDDIKNQIQQTNCEIVNTKLLCKWSLKKGRFFSLVDDSFQNWFF